MNQRQINELNRMHLEGNGATSIADALGVSVNTVRSYLKRHPVTENMHICKQCGSTVSQTSGRKVKQFCSDRCRMQWWNEHRHLQGSRNLVSFTCEYCGKEFRDYEKAGRKYCSRKCYHAALGKRKADSV